MREGWKLDERRPLPRWTVLAFVALFLVATSVVSAYGERSGQNAIVAIIGMVILLVALFVGSAWLSRRMPGASALATWVRRTGYRHAFVAAVLASDEVDADVRDEPWEHLREQPFRKILRRHGEGALIVRWAQTARSAVFDLAIAGLATAGIVALSHGPAAGFGLLAIIGTLATAMWWWSILNLSQAHEVGGAEHLGELLGEPPNRYRDVPETTRLAKRANLCWVVQPPVAMGLVLIQTVAFIFWAPIPRSLTMPLMVAWFAMLLGPRYWRRRLQALRLPD